jgi:hypothetical protein
MTGVVVSVGKAAAELLIELETAITARCRHRSQPGRRTRAYARINLSEV